jgi:predicted Zn finger-like uncharacterized protein
MQVTCPNCAAGYDVPDRLLAPSGRRMRCARCAAEFHAALPSGEAAPSMPYARPDIAAEIAAARSPSGPPATPDLRAPSRQEMSPPPRRGRRLRAAAQVAAALLAWVGSLGLAGAGSYAAISQREAVMQAWAPSVRLYRMIGLADAPATSGADAAVSTAAPEARAMSPPGSRPG